MKIQSYTLEVDFLYPSPYLFMNIILIGHIPIPGILRLGGLIEYGAYSCGKWGGKRHIRAKKGPHNPFMRRRVNFWAPAPDLAAADSFSRARMGPRPRDPAARSFLAAVSRDPNAETKPHAAAAISPIIIRGLIIQIYIRRQ
jgi:hypothetical protein